MEAAAAGGRDADGSCCSLQRFKLYETMSKFYMIGSDKNKTFWKVLTINRLESLELDIREDATKYSEQECYDLLKRIHDGNRATGGIKFITNCYGIIGFIKFLGPYYMLVITKRKQIGSICGHAIYAISKSEMISIPTSSPQSSLSNSKNENRYKRLLGMVDLTKDFFYSYSYHVMRSLQKNVSDSQTGQIVYETMFVWNEFLTRGIRNHLKSTRWTVALVYGFFKQANFSLVEKDFCLTLIARRSRYFAGTRYLKRGVNEKGRVANDVETEQIVSEEENSTYPVKISSIVQNRGSIPLFWSQETSRLNLKPDIILQKKDENYEATRLHFENLAKRYGNPIIILNLIKTHERKPRESLLRAEFVNAIDFINKGLPEEKRLRFLHWDFNKYFRSKTTNVLEILGKVAAYALTLTGFLYGRVTPDLQLESSSLLRNVKMDDAINQVQNTSQEDSREYPRNCFSESTYQRGVLRTNCIDCLDRTNVAQYAYGLTALEHQLHALDMIDRPKIDLDDPLVDDLMSFYEAMGDTLALQYGGSAAHNKIFCERRGQWKAAIQSQEFLRSLQRYYNNAYMDAEKQDAINLFLGYFQPQQGKPALWELGSDQNCHVGRRENLLTDEVPRSTIKRSFSDGSILSEGLSTLSVTGTSKKHNNELVLPRRMQKVSALTVSEGMDQRGDFKALHDLTPLVSPCETAVSYGSERETGGSDFSNFIDLDWLSSCDEDPCERSSLMNSPIGGLSTENVMIEVSAQENSSAEENRSITKGMDPVETETDDDFPVFSERFKQWVIHGEGLCH